MKLSFSTVSLALFLWQLSCSASPLTLKEVKAKAALGFHLIELAEGAEPVWKSEEETDELVAQGVRFVGIFIGSLLNGLIYACFVSSM